MSDERPARAPSARILADATETFAVVDETGRRITVKRLTALDKLRLFKAVGPLLANNAPYFGLAFSPPRARHRRRAGAAAGERKRDRDRRRAARQCRHRRDLQGGQPAVDDVQAEEYAGN